MKKPERVQVHSISHFDMLFERTDFEAVFKFDEDDFSRPELSSCDWKNYVDPVLKNMWNSLTEREKKIIFIMAEKASDLCMSRF